MEQAVYDMASQDMNWTNNDRELLAALEDAWHRLAEPYHCRITRAAFFDGIVNRYSEDGRYYHTLAHVGEMLRLIEPFRGKVADIEAVEFAAWFHDIIYDTHRDDNEERSATLAARTMRRLQVTPAITQRAVELIRATKHHALEGDSVDGKIFLDADLAVLGAEPDRYHEYSEAIRNEYAWVGDEVYRQGRIAFLERMLRRESIYRSEPFREKFEGGARQNIRGELDLLAAS
jgi:predicted metal-dependent HD superfamily phosphohydrolase